MTIARLLTVTSFVILLAGCITAPQKSAKQPYAKECKDMLTRKMEIDEAGKPDNALKACSKSQNLPACLVGAGVISSVSTIVSGSIVIVGNTIHWLEYKTSC